MGSPYYRLKEADVNGSYIYSSVGVVDIRSNIIVMIKPNPVKDVLTISTQAKNTGTTSIQITDNTGKTILAKAIATANGYSHLSLPALILRKAYIM